MIYLKKIGFISLVILMSCGISREEMAKERLDEAIRLSNEGNYNLAKLKLDSLIVLFTDQPDLTEQASKILAGILLQEQQRNLLFIDSVTYSKEKELKSMMKNFIESDEYGSEKILIHKRQKPENSYNRTFIRAHADLKGNFFISSRYYGSKWINHHQIKVYYHEKSATTESVKEDGLNNRRFEDGESKWEIVNYKDGADNGVIDFIASNWKDPLRVQFIGKGYEYIIMELYDREAIRDGYEISFVLKEINKLKLEREKTKKEIEILSKTADEK